MTGNADSPVEQFQDEPSPLNQMKEKSAKTQMTTDNQLPEEGDCVEVEYVSRRTGSEKTRSGEVLEVVDIDDGTLVYMHHKKTGNSSRILTVMAIGEEGHSEVYSLKQVPDGMSCKENSDGTTDFVMETKVARNEKIGRLVNYCQQ